MAPLGWDKAKHDAFAAAEIKRFHIEPTRLDKCDICHR